MTGGNHNEASGGIYTLGFLSLPHNIFLSGGVRIESDQFERLLLLPQLNIAWNADPITFRALGGRTSRSPDFTERFVSTNLASLSNGRNLGNPSLLPESSWNFETGFDFNISRSVNGGFTVFTRHGENLIDYVLTSSAAISAKPALDPTGRYFYAQNIGEVNTRGFELTFNGNIVFNPKYSLDYNAGYTLQKPVSSSGQLSKYISNQARQMISFSSFLRRDRAALGLNALMKQRSKEFAESIDVQLNPKYVLINLQGSYMIKPDFITVELRIENLFNVDYSDILGAGLPGRWISAGLRFNR
jgi:vitamin B12 transporter